MDECKLVLFVIAQYALLFRVEFFWVNSNQQALTDTVITNHSTTVPGCRDRLISETMFQLSNFCLKKGMNSKSVSDVPSDSICGLLCGCWMGHRSETEIQHQHHIRWDVWYSSTMKLFFQTVLWHFLPFIKSPVFHQLTDNNSRREHLIPLLIFRC